MIDFDSESFFCFTSDLDWASEHSIKTCIDIFSELPSPVTYFITHESPLIREQYEKGYAEVGLHPNFMEGSSQGNGIPEIISFLENLYPDAKCFRNHRYFDLNDVSDYMFERGYKFDSNVCTDLEIVKPFFHRSGLLRIPIFMEDGGYLFKKHKLEFESRHRNFFEKGLKVINVHPVHMALNSPNFVLARKLKDELTRDEWNNLSEEEIENLSHKGLGIRTFIISLLENIKASDSKVLSLSDVYHNCISK